MLQLLSKEIRETVFLSVTMETQEWVLFCNEPHVSLSTTQNLFMCLYRIKCPIFLSDCNQTWILWMRFGRSIWFKISRRSVQWDYRWYTWTDIHRRDEGHTNFPQLRERALKCFKLWTPLVPVRGEKNQFKGMEYTERTVKIPTYGFETTANEVLTGVKYWGKSLRTFFLLTFSSYG